MYQLGSVFINRYELEREIGSGGMSVVYLAKDRQLLEKHVVVKLLLEENKVDAWMRQKFLQEMEALSRIDHPGVVGVLDSGVTEDGNRFLVMQFVEGVTLRTILKPEGIDPLRAARIIRQIAMALEAAHQKGILHRDLKPENIMLQTLAGEEHVKLIDFGIAGIKGSQFTGEETKVAGTMSYMAPEQFAKNPCPASDTYSLGVIACELLCGKKPFSSGSMTHLVMPEAPSLGPSLPEAVERSLRKAMAFRPEDRQESSRIFGEEIYRALTGASNPSIHYDQPAELVRFGQSEVEIAHILFMDLVGYSTLPMDRQREHLAELQEIANNSRQHHSTGGVISLPTGDGMALVFFGSPTSPVQCALEIAAELRMRTHLKLRMGINSGPVYRVADVNARSNVAGGGINFAQRVMDCGDAGHILVSKSAADVLFQLSQWAPHLNYLGEFTVKHGIRVPIFNLTKDDLGNPARPSKLKSIPVRLKGTYVAIAIIALLAVPVSYWILTRNDRPVGPDRPSVAVLPFKDLSIEKDQGYFSDGLAEELLNYLSKVPGLKVAGRTSAFQFRGKESDFKLIGEKLSVSSILEGSVRKQANRARISVQLVKSQDGFNLWSDTFDRDLTDIFVVQEDIAKAVAEALKIKLLNIAATAPGEKKVNTAAYNSYLQGKYFLGLRSKENLERASNYFTQALELDGLYAPSWVGLSEAQSFLAMGDYVPRNEGYSKATQAVEKALLLDASLAEAYSAKGRIQMFSGFDWDGALASLNQGLSLQPNNAKVLGVAGVLNRILGRFDTAIDLYRRALEIDPLNASFHHAAGIAYLRAANYTKAKAAFEKAIEINPSVSFSHSQLSSVFLAQGNTKSALDEAQKEKHEGFRLLSICVAQHALKHKQESQRALAELVSGHGADAPYQIADAYAFLGQPQKALEWLDRAYEEKDAGLIEIKGDPLLKTITSDPRYAAMLRKLRLPD